MDPGPGRPGLRCGGYLQTPGLEEQRAREGCFEWGDGSGHLVTPSGGDPENPMLSPHRQIQQELEGKGPVELVRGPSQPVGPWGTEQDGDTASGPWGCHSK